MSRITISLFVAVLAAICSVVVIDGSGNGKKFPSRPSLASAGSGSRKEIARDPADDASPRTYAREFQRMFTNRKPGSDYSIAKTLHATFDSEMRDEKWAPVIEENWRRFYSSKSNVRRYGAPIVECRSTMCEIRLIAEMAGRSVNWNALMLSGIQHIPSRLRQSLSYVATDVQDGKTAVAHIVAYKRRH